MTAAFAKLCPWMATPGRRDARSRDDRGPESRTLSGRRKHRVILLAASWLPAMTKTGILRVAQPAELPDQEQPGVVVAPVAVVEVARDQHEIDALSRWPGRSTA